MAFFYFEFESYHVKMQQISKEKKQTSFRSTTHVTIPYI